MKKFLPALVSAFALYSCGGNPAYAKNPDGIQVDTFSICKLASLETDPVCIEMVEEMLIDAVNIGLSRDYPDYIDPKDTSQAIDFAMRQVDCTKPATEACKALVVDYAYWFNVGFTESNTPGYQNGDRDFMGYDSGYDNQVIPREDLDEWHHDEPFEKQYTFSGDIDD